VVPLPRYRGGGWGLPISPRIIAEFADHAWQLIECFPVCYFPIVISFSQLPLPNFFPSQA
jgi:hypothetical protein